MKYLKHLLSSLFLWYERAMLTEQQRLYFLYYRLEHQWQRDEIKRLEKTRGLQ